MQNQVNSILDDLSKEFDPFVMQMYGTSETQTLYNIEALLYVQEAQLNKFRHDLAVSYISANIVHENHQIDGVCDNVPNNRGRGCMPHGRVRGNAYSSSRVHEAL